MSGLALYHSPKGLHQFQADGVARFALQGALAVIWDTGTGKTHAAMASAALLFEDDEIDLCIIEAEFGKIDPTEWPKDFETFTDLDSAVYHGTAIKRAKMRGAFPPVVISTYETIKNDFTKVIEVVEKKKLVKKTVPSALLEGLKGKRVMFVWDEAPAKLSSRTSQTYKAHNVILKTLRATSKPPRIMVLTATPFDRGPDGAFNYLRLVDPARMGTLAAFDNDHVAAKDFRFRPTRFKNLTPGDTEPGVVSFQEKIGPLLHRKRKTDPDVAPFFPEPVEEFTFLRLGARQQDFYETVQDTFEGCDEWEQKKVFVALRQIASHPLSLLESKGEIAQTIVKVIGAGGLEALGSAKTDRLVEMLRPVVKGQGAQVVVFSFFRSSLSYIGNALESAGYTIALHHGQMTGPQRTSAKEAFRGGKVEVFLSSDAGSRGLNLPEASYVFNYEMPLTHSMYTQRINRVNRIHSPHGTTVANSLVALDTIEEGILALGHRRNEWQDKVLADDEAGEEFLTAQQRWKLSRISRKHALNEGQEAA